MKIEKRCPVKAIYGYAYNKIELADPEWSNAFGMEEKYLRSLDVDRLLAGFLETAGFQSKAKRYGGWEITEIQGHTLGHYLTAAAQIYEADQNAEWLDKIEYIIEQLVKCQSEDGYLFASDREIFDRIENRKPAWVPWYTMHKILSGIIRVYEVTANKMAYQLMNRLGTWIAARCEGWDEEIRNLVLSVEYGGMNDCLYDLYWFTGEERFARAAHQFDEMALFEPIHEGRDILNGLHANTTIPKILGVLKRYMVLGETQKFYLEVAQSFWKIVVDHHTYATGGNSEWEHFGEADVLDAERTACNCETCNTYNMLKLSLHLFEITGEKKYIDYYTHAKLNAILSSQNPETGMTMYFQPMETGYFKVFTTPYDSFWCCTGSGMENFTKLWEGIFFQNENGIYIGQYVSSRLKDEKRNITLKMDVEVRENILLTKISVEQLSDNEVGIYLRIPEWLEKEAEVYLNGISTKVVNKDGFIKIHRKWMQSDIVAVQMQMTLRVHELPDNKNVAAFSYGPYLLSAGLGNVMMDLTTTGVDVLVPQKEIAVKDYLVLENVDVSKWLNNIEKYMVKEKGKIAFHLYNQGEELIFTPHYARYQERYGIYWRLYKKESKDLKGVMEKANWVKKLKSVMTDIIPIGNDQYELAHKIKGEKTDTQRLDGHPYRFCRADGWFSYQMKLGAGKHKLCMSLCRQDAGNGYQILLDEVLLVEECIRLPEEGKMKTNGNTSYEANNEANNEASDQGSNKTNDQTEFYQVEYIIPEITEANKEKYIVVKFQNVAGRGTFRIFDELYLKKCDRKI